MVLKLRGNPDFSGETPQNSALTIILAFFSIFAYNMSVEQKNIGFFRGDGACIVSVFFDNKLP